VPGNRDILGALQRYLDQSPIAAVQALRAELDTLTTSESDLRSRLEEVTRSCDERLEKHQAESAGAIEGLSTMLQANQSEFLSIISELEFYQKRLADTTAKLDERSTELESVLEQLSKVKEELSGARLNEKRLQLQAGEAESLADGSYNQLRTKLRKTLDKLHVICSCLSLRIVL
jgi:chromosome segregation ATPase